MSQKPLHLAGRAGVVAVERLPHRRREDMFGRQRYCRHDVRRGRGRQRRPRERVHLYAADRLRERVGRLSAASGMQMRRADGLASWELYRQLPPAGDAKRRGGGANGGRDRQEIQEDSLGGRTTDLFRRALDADVVTRSEALNYLDVPEAVLDQLGARTA